MELTVISPGTTNIITNRDNDTINLIPIYAMEKSIELDYEIQLQTIGAGLLLGIYHEEYNRNDKIYPLYSANYNHPVIIMVVPDSTNIIQKVSNNPEPEYLEVYKVRCIVRIEFEETGKTMTISFPISIDAEKFDEIILEMDEEDLISTILIHLNGVVSGKISSSEVFTVDPRTVLFKYIDVISSK